MFPSIDELMKAQAEAFKTTNSVATTAFDGARKLLELNVQAARAGMEESSAQLKALLAARDVSALNTLLADLFSQFSRPEGNKAAAYVKDVYDIAQQTHSQVAELIEKQVASSSCWPPSMRWPRTPRPVPKGPSSCCARAWSRPTPPSRKSRLPRVRCWT